MKERNEYCNSRSIKRKVKIGAWAFACIIPVIIVSVFTYIILQDLTTILFVTTACVLSFIFCYVKIRPLVQETELAKLYTALVEKCLLIQEYTEVKPNDIDAFNKEMLRLADSYTEILPLQDEDAEEYRISMLALLETVKIYARISKTKKDSIEIFVKYDNEEELRYYKTIDKADFLDEFSIQEEDEQ